MPAHGKAAQQATRKPRIRKSSPPTCPVCNGTRQVFAIMVPGDPGSTHPCLACTPPAAPAPLPAPVPGAGPQPAPTGPGQAPPALVPAPTRRAATGRAVRRTAKWLPDAANGLRRLRLTIHTLAGEQIAHDYELEQVVNGMRLYRLDVTATPPAVIVYTIRTDGPQGAWTCDCPAATKGKQEYVCKHLAGLKAALAALPF